MPPVTTVLSDPAALRVLALAVFGVSIVQALGEVLPAWGVPDQWPRAGALSRPIFVTIFLAGLGVASLGILAARRSPTAAWAMTFASYLGLALALDAPTWLTAGDLTVAVTVCLVAHRSRFVSTALVLTGTLVAYTAMVCGWALWRLHLSPGETGHFVLYMLTNFAPLVGAAAVLGALLGRLSRRVDVARKEAEAALFERARSVALAQAEERARVAQELHDVAAQHLAGLLALADAVVDLAGDEPETALGLVADVRAEGRFAAASIYGALRELRAPESERAAPTPDVRQVASLVDHWRKRGMAVDLLPLGDLTVLPAVVSVTAFRIVQEALANAAKHAPGSHVWVRVLADLEHVSVSVENAQPTRPTAAVDDGIGLGWGLTGLRERLALLGGTFTAGPTPEGGWRVSSVLPRNGAEVASRAPDWAP